MDLDQVFIDDDEEKSIFGSLSGLVLRITTRVKDKSLNTDMAIKFPAEKLQGRI